jgi:hypothetical protein
MNIISLDPATTSGNRFIKVTFDKDEVALLINDLNKAADRYSYLSPAGLFTLAMLVEHSDRPKSVEITWGENGVKDILQDLDYKLRNSVKSHPARLLVCHLQYFLMCDTVRNQVKASL